jgi:ATP-dependent helicase HrpA
MSGSLTAPGPSAARKIRFPRELPITARVDDIAAAVKAHPVVIVVGATGSGKTTQLPKIMLELGRGLERRIGVTQPRRIAATSVAARVATELETAIGGEVGYQIRFEDRTGPATRVKFMTDGILLAETQGDRLLRGYDTIIIDEAHERSLNIDFLLGWLKRILPQRPDLKLIVSSATIEADRFSAFFAGAPVVTVEGRTYPVDVLYEPPDPELDPAEVVANAVANIAELDSRGDVLVFLPGEREIREAEQELLRRRLRHTQILPLYARLSGADQRKVFSTTPGRRVILATNVAETSLTIPGIVYVVDTGLARLSRYDPRTGTTRLQIEAISQASADQRKGRCGRVREGICIRLYDEQSFQGRPAFTDPEMRRVGLAGVILRMKDLGLGDVEDFPLLDPPSGRSIAEGYRVLEELGALDEERELTPLGRRLARLPVDPRVARMVLAGIERGCLPDVLVLAAALNVQDPRERPRGAEQKADQQHQRFKDARSDFAGVLKLWAFVRDAQAQSTSQLKRVCKEGFLSFPRVREWMELHRQLQEIASELGPGPGAERRRERGAVPRGGEPQPEPSAGRRTRRRRGEGQAVGAAVPAKAESTRAEQDVALHLALLSGLLSRIGQYNVEQRVYMGARQTRFLLHPSSALAKKPPAWVMAFELVQTTQLYARTVAKLEPEWLDQVGGHLLKRSYSEPHWSEKSGRASVREHATLFGLPVLRDRSVDYATISPGRARLIFIEHALVRGEYQSRGAFQDRNRALMAEVARLRDKARQSELLTDDDVRLGFFDRRVPEGVVNGKTFESWREDAERKDPDVLVLSLADVLAEDRPLSPDDYPDTLAIHGVPVALSYRFEPAAEDDGITLALPLALLPQLDPGELDWIIPAWHVDKIAALIESLPKLLRKDLGASDELARRLGAKLVPFSGALLPALARALFEVTGVHVPPEAFRVEGVPAYLRFTFRVHGERGNVLAQHRDLGLLIREHGARAADAIRQAVLDSGFARGGLTAWTFGELPAHVTRRVLGTELRLYPTLIDRGAAVELTLLESPRAAELATRAGVRRLLALGAGRSLAVLRKRVPPPFTRRAGLPPSRAESDAFAELVLDRTVHDAFRLASAPLPRSAKELDALLATGSARLEPTFNTLNQALKAVSDELERTQRALDAASKQPGATAASKDLRAQLEHLFPPDLIERIELAQLAHFPRYLRAMQMRLTRALSDPRKDADKLAPLAPLWASFLAKLPSVTDVEAAAALRWAFEELRVAIFAPELKPARPVSLANLTLAVAALR